MKMLTLVSLFMLSLNAFGLRQADNSLAYKFETASGAEVEPAKAVQEAMCNNAKIYKTTVKGHKTTRELVEAVVTEKGAVSLKAVK